MYNRTYKPYIPQTIGDVMDQLGFMMLSSPTFVDNTNYFPEQNIETVFFQLNEGLKAIRSKIGEDSYAALTALSNRMRAHFEADPEDETEDGLAGRALIHEMQDLLSQC